MSQRIPYIKTSSALFQKFSEFSTATREGAIELSLRHLVTIRASQLNGCAFCLDMHVKEAALHEERELRLHHLPIWRESPLFSERERAALEWTEALTRIPEHGVSDELYERVHAQFSDLELTDLTYVVMAINAWNRINIAFRTEPGQHDKAFGLDKAQLR